MASLANSFLPSSYWALYKRIYQSGSDRETVWQGPTNAKLIFYIRKFLFQSQHVILLPGMLYTNLFFIKPLLKSFLKSQKTFINFRSEMLFEDWKLKHFTELQCYFRTCNTSNNTSRKISYVWATPGKVNLLTNRGISLTRLKTIKNMYVNIQIHWGQIYHLQKSQLPVKRKLVLKLPV